MSRGNWFRSSRDSLLEDAPGPVTAKQKDVGIFNNSLILAVSVIAIVPGEMWSLAGSKFAVMISKIFILELRGKQCPMFEE